MGDRKSFTRELVSPTKTVVVLVVVCRKMWEEVSYEHFYGHFVLKCFSVGKSMKVSPYVGDRGKEDFLCRNFVSFIVFPTSVVVLSLVLISPLLIETLFSGKLFHVLFFTALFD